MFISSQYGYRPSDTKVLRLYHESTRRLVYGYLWCFIRQFGPFFNDDLYSLIAYITTIYYQHYEYFTCHGSKLSLKSGIHTIRSFGSFTEYSTAYNTVYGNIQVSNLSNSSTVKYVWTFRVFRTLWPRGIFAIGIDSSNKQFIETTFYDRRWNPKNHCYSLQFEASDVTTKYSQRERNIKYAPCKYKEITIIKMSLDVKKQTLSYSFDGNDHGVAFKDVNFENNRKYSMALILDNQYSTVIQLIDFCELTH